MGCGCSKVKASPERARTAALMCIDCPESITLTINGHRVGGCKVTGRPIILAPNVLAKCPIGRHPDKDGLVTWRGVRWIGVPYPIRLLRMKPLRWITRKDPYTKPPPGCGCVFRLKTAWTKFRAEALWFW